MKNNKKIISLFIALSIMFSLAAINITVSAETQIERAIATVNQSQVMLSWKNPSGSIDGIEILNEDGNAVVTDSEPSTASGDISETTVSGLTSGKKYTYTIVINMQSGETIKSDVSFTTGINYQWDSQNGVKMYDFAKLRIEQGSSLLPFYVELSEDAAHSGGTGLHAVSNDTGWVNLKFEMITLDSSKKYRASAWIKAKDISREVWLCSDNSGKVMISNNTDWQRYSFDISGSSWFIMNLQSAMTTFSDLWADDFAVYELDADGNEIGDNLLPNGGFEYAVYDYAVNDGTITWTEPESASYSGVDVYLRKSDGTEKKLNDEKIPAGTTSCEIPAGTVGDESYDLLFVNHIGDTATPARVYSVLGKADYYDTVLKQGGSEVSTIAPGEIEVSRFVKNNAMGAYFSATLMLGLYKDNELTELQYKSAAIPQNGTKTEISDKITIPDDGAKYELRVFLWDSPEQMNILKGFDSYTMN